MRKLDHLRIRNEACKKEDGGRPHVEATNVRIEGRKHQRMKRYEIEEIKYKKEFQRRYSAIEKRTKWDNLNITVIVQDIATGMQTNFSIPYDDGLLQLRISTLKGLKSKSGFSGGLGSLWYFDPVRNRTMALATERDLMNAVLISTMQGKQQQKTKETKQTSQLVYLQHKAVPSSISSSKKAASEAILIKNVSGQIMRKSRKNKTLVLDKEARQKLLREQRAEKKETVARLKEQKRREDLERKAQARLRKQKARATQVALLKNMSQTLPPVPNGLPGIVWSPLLQKYETSFVIGGGGSSSSSSSSSKKYLGLFKTKELAWSAICLEAQRQGISTEQLSGRSSSNNEMEEVSSRLGGSLLFGQEQLRRMLPTQRQKVALRGSAMVGQGGRDG